MNNIDIRDLSERAIIGGLISQLTLGDYYLESNNYKEALKWYRLAAAQGNAFAQYNLGAMYENGRGVPKDEKVAVKWYRLAAAQGYAFAQYFLGAMYANGRGVPRDDQEAVKWYRLAAAQGNAIAQSILGWTYANGRGVPKDDLEALKWYRLAAAQGNAFAQTNLGAMYANGRGLPKDYEEALKWNRLAADQGNAQSSYQLGVMYESGHGVPQDYDEAIKWFRKSGSEQANTEVLRIERQNARRKQRGNEDSNTNEFERIQCFINHQTSAFIGMDSIKKEILKLATLLLNNDQRKKQGLKSSKPPSKHMVFTGGPGTGKTTVAQILADIYFDLGIISKNTIVEVDRSGLVGAYVGQTALKTKSVLESALGGVLFIDEAYALDANGGKDDHGYGGEAITIMLKFMEDHREDITIIMAGYKDEMDSLLKINPGLRSRFNRFIHFNNYSPSELLSILCLSCKNEEYEIDPGVNDLLLDIFDEEIKAKGKEFSNGRFIRNLFEKMKDAQALRLAQSGDNSKKALMQFTYEDVQISLSELCPVSFQVSQGGIVVP